MRSLYTTHSDSSRLAGAIALQHTRTLVGWLVRSLYTKHSDSSRLAGAIAKPNTVG
ncbi:hypothetical protein [Limnospira maxima]|uniref:hypothetical protein n=1 Tax=Limnospira maxima TaxID=129910 RepID=UPI001F2A3B73|nr:hypothetical protein [Limnospira maxima]